MQTIVQKNLQAVKTPKFTLLYLDELVQSHPSFEHDGFNTMMVETTDSCGLELLIAHPGVSDAVTTCVTILMQLAFSESLHALSQRGMVTMNVEVERSRMLEVTVILMSKESLEKHVLCVFRGDIVFMAFPSFPKYEGHSISWLYNRLVCATGHRP